MTAASKMSRFEILKDIHLVDAHHHMWQLNRFPYSWLRHEAGEARFGDKSKIAKDYLLQDYLGDCDSLPLSASVHVEAHCGAHNPVDETVWLQDLHEQTGWPSAIVAAADLSCRSGRRLVEQHLRNTAVRGIRTPVAWDDRGRWRVAPRPGLLAEPEFRSSLADLEYENLCLELVVVPEQLIEVHDVASAFPRLKIVLNHFAHLQPQLPGDITTWSQGISRLAENDNIILKLSGLWTIDRKWDQHVLWPHVKLALECFGSSRMMYGSNLPVERVNCPVEQQFVSLSAMLSHLSFEQRTDIFSRTARHVYRLCAQ